jgi:hypothetical protein
MAISVISPGYSLYQAHTFLDENRIKEIKKIANTMKVDIPKKFDNKTAIREFI